MKRHLHVACAIIIHNGKILAAQRSESMTLPLKWEFPGGKIETGEDAADCLQRELLEELGITVTIDRPLPTATHSYDDFTVTLYPFVCRLSGGDITLHEHKAIAWTEPGRMTELDWAEADLPVIDAFLASHATGSGGSRQ
ncbi:MAG TPA: 8-oxo-dGTP diphosphatase MutT [Geobacter sp.]|nr:8-oxo-dGTP diphosphatase MutT [Geobacter sp.]